MTLATSPQTTPSSRRRRHGRTLLIGAAVLGLAGAGLAWAAVQRPLASLRHFGGGAMKLHAEFMVDRALKQVDATDEQRREVEAIVGRLFERHKARRAEHQGMHDELAAALTAEKVDRARLESLRARHLAQAEACSREIAAAVADAADVLTVEQRRALLEWLHEQHQ